MTAKRIGACTVGVGERVSVRRSSAWVKVGAGSVVVGGIVAALFGVAAGVGRVVRKEHAQITAAIARLLSQRRVSKAFLIAVPTDRFSLNGQ